VNSGIISVGLPETDSDDLLLLARWLRDEDEFRGRVTVINQPAEPGHMGAVVDVLQVAVGSEGAATALVLSLFGWLHHRRTAQKVTMRIKLENGTEAEFTCASTEGASALLDKVHAMIGD
jgi:membrane-associated two-gene conflict system component 1 (EACC1)